MIRRPSPRPAVVTTMLLVVLSASCSDSSLVSAPSSSITPQGASLDHGKLGDMGLAPVARAVIVRRTSKLTADETACAVVSPLHGATISLKKSGLKVTFDQGAVSASTNICIVAPAGDLLTYNFLPHGLQFNSSIKVEQDLKLTNAHNNHLIQAALVGGYLANGIDTDVDLDGVGTFAQVFDVSDSDSGLPIAKVTSSSAKFYTNHFSGYALASGRM
ncbi:MAG: hypothetical protein ABJE10_13730 [bacterium]